MKKALALLLSGTMAATALAGCGAGASSSTAASTDSTAASSATTEATGEKPTITFYHGYFQDEATWAPASEMRKLYDEFAELHKDEYTFKAVALDTGNQGVYDKCIQEISAGTFPDIVDAGGMNIVPAASEAGFALDLKPYIDEDADFKAGVGVNYEQNLVDGKIYTVRDQLETIGFWYNEDLFNKAGADTPDKWQSWDDFNTAVDKLIASPDVETPFSMNQDWPTTILLSGYLLGSEGGRAFGSSVPTDFNNDAFKGALDFLGTNVLGKVDAAHFTAADSEAYREDFFAGKAAMLFNGVWESGSFAGGDLAIDPSVIKPAVFPTQEAGKTAAIVSASTGYVVNAQLDDVKKQACVDFVKFMTSKETAATIFEKVQAMPASSTIDYDAYINGDYDVTVKSLAEACKLALAADYKLPTAGSVWGEDISSAISSKYAGIFDGSKTTDQIVEELNSLLEE